MRFGKPEEVIVRRTESLTTGWHDRADDAWIGEAIRRMPREVVAYRWAGRTLIGISLASDGTTYYGYCRVFGPTGRTSLLPRLRALAGGEG